jgi:hypothetical protein
MGMSKYTFLACGGLLVVLAMTLGCGGKKTPTVEANRGRVTGIVTFDGKPLGGGQIGFVLAKDPMYRKTAMIKPDGTFSTRDAPLGDVLVSVENESAKMFNPNGYVPIPRKYSNVKTSGLKAMITVSDDPEGLKLPPFELKSK